MPSDCAIRVLVVDDHPAIRAGIVNLIDAEHPSLIAVGTAASADEALDQTQLLQPHVVVLDVDLNGEDGMALIPSLHRAAPCRVVVLSSLLDPHLAAHAKRLGAHACLHKTSPAAELLACISTSPGTGDGQTAVRAESRASLGTDMHEEPQSANAAVGSFLRRTDAVTAIEYGLLAALIAVAVIGAFTATGESLENVFVYWSTTVSTALAL